MAWIGAVVGGIASLLSSKQQSTQNSQQNALINQQVTDSQKLGTIGTGLMQQGDDLALPATKRLLALAAGNRGETWNAIAPEVAQVNAQGNEADRVASELMPRGGGRAQILASEPSRRADSINQLFMTSRANANNQLLTLADSKTRLGLGAMGSSLGGLQGATTGSINVRNQQFQQAQQLGGGLANAWNQFYSWYANQANQPGTPGGSPGGAEGGSDGGVP